MKTKTSGKFARAICVCFGVGLLLTPLTDAADVTWTNAASNLTWNTTSSNWSTGLWNNANADGAIFGATGIGSISVATPITLRSLNFTSSGYTLTGSNALTFSTAGTSTLAAGTINVATGSAAISAPITSTSGLNLSGAGTLTISNSSNSFGGLVPIGFSGVSVNLQLGSAIDTAAGGNLTLSSAAALPASTAVGIGSGVLNIGATSPTISQLTFSSTNEDGGSNGRVNGTTGMLTVSGEIQVFNNFFGSGNQIAAKVNIPSGTQMIRVGGLANANRELVFNNVISGAGGLLKTYFLDIGGTTALGGFTMLGNNTYTGATTISGTSTNIVTGTNASTALNVSGGTLTLQGASGSFTSAPAVNLTPGGVLVLDNVASIAADGGIIPAVAAGNLSNRLSTSAALSMQGGTFLITGAASLPSNQQVASLTASAGFNTVTLNPGASGTSIFSATGNLGISGGATVLFRATTLPLTTAVTQGTTAFTFAGTTPTPVGAAGIIVGAIGSTSPTGNGSGFVRYVSTGNVGIALLAPGEYTANYTTAGANVDVTSTQSVSAPITVNAIRTTGFTTTLNAPVTVTSGMILATTATSTIDGSSALAFGGNRAYFLGGSNFAVSAPITGSAGLTKSSANTLTLSGDNSGLSGGVIVQSGTLTFATNTAATNFGGTLNVLQGTARFSVADSGTGAVNLGSAAAPANTAVAAATLDINNAAVTSFSRAINVLGNGGAQPGGLTFLALPSTNITQNVSSPINLGNNLSIPSATGILNLTGPITGNGGLIFTGNSSGTVNITNPGNNLNGDLVNASQATVDLAGSVNAGSGGTSLENGTIRIAAANSLGSGLIKLSFGTLQADASMTLNQNFNVIREGTFKTGANNLTLAGQFNGAGSKITKFPGVGTLTLTGTGNYSGTFNVPAGAGTLTISGNGNLARLGTVTLGSGTILNIDNSAINLSNRVGSTTNVTFDSSVGATMNLTTNSATDSFSLGTLSVTGGFAGNPNTSTLNLIDGGAGNHTVTFAGVSSIGANNSLRFAGTTNFGGPGTAGTRVFLSNTSALAGASIPNATFTGSGGSGPAGYDATRGVIRYVTSSVSGNLIDNVATSDPNATNALAVPIGAIFTTTTIYPGAANASARANTGATIDSLILDGASLTLFNAYNPGAGNPSTSANGTLAIGNQITSQNGAKTIYADAAATTPTISFGGGLARFTTTSDLTLASPITLSGSGGLTKNGAGALTIAGTYAVTGTVLLNAGALNLSGPATLDNLTSGGAGTSVNLGANALTLNSTVNTTFAGNITAGSLTKTGSATLTLSPPGTLSYSGATIITAGTLALGVSNALPATSALTIGSIATGGARLALNGFNQTVPGITLYADSDTFTSRISTGAGTLTLNGDLTFLDNTSTPGTGFLGGINSTTGGSLNLGGAVRTFTLPAQNNNTDASFSIPITNGGIVFNGQNSTALPAVVSTTTLNAVNTYTLGTTVARGVINTTVTNALPTGGAVVLGTANSANFGAISLFGFNQTIGALSLATGNSGGASNAIGNTSGTTATLTISSATDAVFGGSIGGNIFVLDVSTAAANLSLIKSGIGTQTLTGVNPYTGTTTVNGGGKLRISGGITGTTAVTVNSATLELGGSNVINDAATMNLTGGTLATGGFSETVGALTLGAGASVFDMGSGASLFHFANSSSAPTWTGTLSITNWSGLPGGGGTDQLFFGTSTSGLLALQIARITFLNPSGLPAGTYGSQLLATGELVAIPEPGSSALLLTSLSLLLARRRR